MLSGEWPALVSMSMPLEQLVDHDPVEEAPEAKPEQNA